MRRMPAHVDRAGAAVGRPGQCCGADAREYESQNDNRAYRTDANGSRRPGMASAAHRRTGSRERA